MRILITEEQSSKLFEAAKEGFRLDCLLSTSDYKERINYCREMLGKPIGSGSSRIVFQIDDYACLKLAKNEEGIAQNLEEIKLGTERVLSCFPKILNGSDENNGLWIISEYVLPVSKNDFRKVLGISFTLVQRFIWSVFMVSKNRHNNFASNVTRELYDDFEGNEDVIDLFNSICELCFEFSQNVGDLKRIENWGLCFRNRKPTLVILDSGLFHLKFITIIIALLIERKKNGKFKI